MIGIFGLVPELGTALEKLDDIAGNACGHQWLSSRFGDLTGHIAMASLEAGIEDPQLKGGGLNLGGGEVESLFGIALWGIDPNVFDIVLTKEAAPAHQVIERVDIAAV